MGLETYRDIVKYESVDQERVQVWAEDNTQSGPLDGPWQLDFRAEGESAWNHAMWIAITAEIQIGSKSPGPRTFSDREDDYVITELEEIFSNVRTLWRNSRCKVLPNGRVETPEEAQDRNFRAWKIQDKLNREGGRRRQVRDQILLHRMCIEASAEMGTQKRDHALSRHLPCG